MHALYRKNVFVYIFFGFVAAIYLHNLTRDIYSGDMGDLATAGCVWGVAHPSGYPLFTLLGNILCHLPLPIPPVTKVALISVAASLAGLVLFYKLSLRVTKSMFLGLLSTSILAFSYLYWVHAELPEVFALNNFFVIAILYFAILFHEEKKPKYLYLTALLTGLSVSHHHTIIFIFPAILILVLRHIKLIWTKKMLFPAILWSVAGLLPYLYVPIAASRNPVINWDNAVTVQNFLHLFFRTDYGTAPTSFANNIPEAVKHVLIKRFLNSMLLVFSYQVIFLAGLGVIQLLRTKKLILAALILAFTLSGPFFVYYASNFMLTIQSWGIIERFYSMPAVIIMFFVPYGLFFIKNYLDKRFKRGLLTLVFLAYFLIVPIMMFWYNVPKTDLSRTTIGNTLAANILNSLPPNAILFLSGDTTTFNTWYVHYVLKVRPDVQILHPSSSVGNRYLDEEINKYHSKHPEIPLNRVLPNTLQEIMKTRRIFTTRNTPITLPGTTLLPSGQLSEVIFKKDIPTEGAYYPMVEKNLRLIKPLRREKLTLAEQNVIAAEIPLIYSNALVRIGDFSAAHYKNYTKAEHYYRRALWIDDGNSTAYSRLSIAQFKGFKDCPNSIYNMKQAIKSYPVWEAFYKQLHYIYGQCKASQQAVDELESLYHDQFGASLYDKP